MTDVVVYGPPQSTFVRSVRMTLEEKGVAYVLEPVEFKQPSHLALHPFGRVPAFRHGDLQLYESSAIMVYVDGAFDGPALHPEDPVRRVRMVQWMSMVNDYYDKDVTRGYVQQYVFAGEDGPDREKIDAALVDVRHHFGIADAALKKAPFLSGDALSLADLMLAPVVFYVTRMPEGEEVLAAYPDLGRWFEAIKGRPSFAATTPPVPSDQAAA